MSKNDGGPVFPQNDATVNMVNDHDGMTERVHNAIDGEWRGVAEIRERAGLPAPAAGACQTMTAIRALVKSKAIEHRGGYLTVRNVPYQVRRAPIGGAE